MKPEGKKIRVGDFIFDVEFHKGYARFGGGEFCGACQIHYDKQVDNGVGEYHLPIKTTKEFNEAVWVLRDKIVEELRKQ